VVVDIVVSNGNGEPFTGLKQEDFEVLEDGKPQCVATLEEHSGTATNHIELASTSPFGELVVCKI